MVVLGPPPLIRRKRLQLHPSEIRGTAYFPSIAHMMDKVQAWLRPGADLGAIARFGNLFQPRLVFARNGRRTVFPAVEVGQFNHAHVEQELRFLRQVGFNNIRLIGSFFAWIINNEEFRRNLEIVVRICARLGMTITYNVWSATQGKDIWHNDAWRELLVKFSKPNLSHRSNKEFAERLGAASVVSNNAAMQLSVPPRGSVWFADAYPEPGHALVEQYGLPSRWPGPAGLGKVYVDRYLTTVGDVFRGFPGYVVFQSYDLFNEFDVFFGRPQGDNQALYTRTNNAVSLLQYTYDQLMRAHPGAACTVGLGDVNNLPQLLARTPNVRQAYLSWHAYFEDRDLDRARRDFDKARRLARGKPVVLSEFNTPAHLPTLGYLEELYIDNLNRYNMGGQMWSYLQTNNASPIGFLGGPRELVRPTTVARPAEGFVVPVDPYPWTARGIPRFENVYWPRPPRLAARDRQAVFQWTGMTKAKV